MSNSEYVLSADAIELIKREEKVQTRLAFSLKVTEKKIIEWAEENSAHGKLLTPGAVNILQQELRLPPNQILVMATIKQAAPYTLPVASKGKKSRAFIQ